MPSVSNNGAPAHQLSYSEAQLTELARDTLAQVKRQGASAAEVVLGESFGTDIGVRAGACENITVGQQLTASLTVYAGTKMGGASSNSFAAADLSMMTARAIAIAKQMNDDECNGLPDAAWLTTAAAPNLDLYHPWQPQIADAVKLANEMSEASWAVDKRVSRSKSEGAQVSFSESRAVLANTLDFSSCRTRSRADLSCVALAELDEGMETDAWYDSKVARADLEDHLVIGRKAGERAVARAGARSISSAKVPVLFEAGSAHGLMGALMGGIGGNAVYRKLTYLADALGKPVCAAHLTLREDPYIVRGARSAHHDSEGVRTVAKDIIKDGELQTFLLSSYSARKLDQASTGNAGGTRNLHVGYRELEFDALVREMGRGLLVTSTMGRGSNFVTGDYSAGASGFWVENGAIAYPVKDATIAGDLRAIYAGIVAGGSDRRVLGGTDCGSLLVDELTVGGNS